MRQKDEIRWRKRINNYGQKVNWMGQQHVFWTKYNVKGIWRRRVCCWQERNAVASIWKKGYSTPWGKRLWHTRAEQHACPGTASVEFQRQIFIRASSLPACPTLQPETAPWLLLPGHCLCSHPASLPLGCSHLMSTSFQNFFLEMPF